MNKKQKLVLLLALLAFLFTVGNAPWVVSSLDRSYDPPLPSLDIHYSPLWQAPSAYRTVQLSLSTLAATWAALLLATGGLLALVGNRLPPLKRKP